MHSMKQGVREGGARKRREPKKPKNGQEKCTNRVLKKRSKGSVFGEAMKHVDSSEKATSNNRE